MHRLLDVNRSTLFSNVFTIRARNGFKMTELHAWNILKLFGVLNWQIRIEHFVFHKDKVLACYDVYDIRICCGELLFNCRLGVIHDVMFHKATVVTFQTS